MTLSFGLSMNRRHRNRINESKLSASRSMLSLDAVSLTDTRSLRSPAIDLRLGLPLLSVITGISSAIAVSYGRKLVTSIDRIASFQPMISPLLGSAIGCLFFLRSDISVGPASTFTVDRDLSNNSTISFSLSRALLRYLAVLIDVGSGTPVALAGPAAEVGITIGKLWSSIRLPFRIQIDETSLDTLLLAGAAAGFASNFDTPLAGMIYALEISTRLIPARKTDGPRSSLDLRTICLLMASISAALFVRRFHFDTLTRHVYSRHAYELSLAAAPALIALSVLAGVFGSCFEYFWKFSFINRWIGIIPRQVRPLLSGVAGSLSVAVIGESQALSDGFRHIDKLLFAGQDYSLKHSFTYLFAKTAAVGVSIASGIIGGIVAPSIFMGASLGHVFHSIVFPPNVSSTIYTSLLQ